MGFVVLIVVEMKAVMKNTLSKDDLIAEVLSVFPSQAKPKGVELTVHEGNDCPDCQDVQYFIDNLPIDAVSDEAIARHRLGLVTMNPRGWLWVLPGYLRVCLIQAADAKFKYYEIGALVGIIADTPLDETANDLSLFNKDQIGCLIHFFEWCSSERYWREWGDDAPSDDPYEDEFDECYLPKLNAAIAKLIHVKERLGGGKIESGTVSD